MVRGEFPRRALDFRKSAGVRNGSCGKLEMYARSGAEFCTWRSPCTMSFCFVIQKSFAAFNLFQCLLFKRALLCLTSFVPGFVVFNVVQACIQSFATRSIIIRACIQRALPRSFPGLHSKSLLCLTSFPGLTRNQAFFVCAFPMPFCTTLFYCVQIIIRLNMKKFSSEAFRAVGQT